MPGADGLELLKQYRVNPVTCDTPIIMLSGTEDPAVLSQAFALGANDYLVKLPDEKEGVARIRYHIQAYRNTQALQAALLELQRQNMTIA